MFKKLIANTIKKFIENMKQFITEYIGDFFILSGLVVIAITTFLLSTIIGLYVTGIILFLLGVYFAFNPIGRR